MEEQSKNVLGESLQVCSMDPKTGFYRTGFCSTGTEDRGAHTVCAVMTPEFLEFTKQQGNDLSTPNEAFGFPGLKPGDSWCLCASRWLEAYNAGVAPLVDLDATEISTLKTVSMDALKEKSLK